MPYILSFKRKGAVTPSGSDLVALGILPKQISEFTNDDIGTEVSIPYTDAGGVISGPIVFEVVGVNHHTNSEHQKTITLMTKNIIRYAAFDAKEPNNPLFDEMYGQYLRQVEGNNRWSVSNIRQWLNSSGVANSWFTAQHTYDEAPTSDKVTTVEGVDVAYADKPGFLAGFSEGVRAHFTKITNTTAVPNADKDGNSETTDDYVFLPSYTEMFGSTNSRISEGTYLSKFDSDSSRKKTGANGWYWMRSPNTETAYAIRVILDDGSHTDLSMPSCRGNGGIAPIIVLH